MASILKVDELQGIVSAGDITVTSEGGAATQSLQQGLAKAWGNLNGSTFAVRDSFGASSVSDAGVGLYTYNFSNAFTDANYSPVSSGLRRVCGVVVASMATTSCPLDVEDTSASNADSDQTMSHFHGDLA